MFYVYDYDMYGVTPMHYVMQATRDYACDMIYDIDVIDTDYDMKWMCNLINVDKYNVSNAMNDPNEMIKLND